MIEPQIVFSHACQSAEYAKKTLQIFILPFRSSFLSSKTYEIVPLTRYFLTHANLLLREG